MILLSFWVKFPYPDGAVVRAGRQEGGVLGVPGYTVHIWRMSLSEEQETTDTTLQLVATRFATNTGAIQQLEDSTTPCQVCKGMYVRVYVPAEIGQVRPNDAIPSQRSIIVEYRRYSIVHWNLNFPASNVFFYKEL
jgi:hypothetical protein